MNKSTFIILTVFFAIAMFSCSEKESTSSPIDPIKELQFEVYDSITVDVLDDLVLLDYQEELDQYMMREKRGGNVFLVNGKGTILDSAQLVGEGPDQLPFFLEGRFLGKDRFVFKEMSPTMDFHVFDRDFKKIEKLNGPAVGLNAIFISQFRQTFTIWSENGEIFILGEEVNSYNPADADPDKIGGEFYNKVKTGFFYDLSVDSITYLSLYPEAWVPRKTNRWVGQSFPYMSFDSERKKVAVLPPIGDLLFMYDLEGNSLINEKAVPLSHPDRDQEIPDASSENQLYSSFSDVKNFGEYQLAIFYTAIPEEVFSEFRAKGENFNQDPEYREALSKYRNPRYIIVKGDQQIGIVNKLPVEGDVNLGLSDGTLIVKASEGEVERDHNLFYKIRLVKE
jgi:hypothetical protein